MAYTPDLQAAIDKLGEPANRIADERNALKAAVKDCAEYLTEITDDLGECDPQTGSWCSKFCNQYGCARMRLQHCKSALAKATP